MEEEPITDRPRRGSPEKQKELDAVLQHMEKEGIVDKYNSQWLSHPHLVRNKSGNYRVTVDFRRLNERIEPDVLINGKSIMLYTNIHATYGTVILVSILVIRNKSSVTGNISPHASI